MREQNMVKVSKVRIPPKARDDWLEKAQCYDQYPVTVEMCDGCPVLMECRLLHDELNKTVNVQLDGVWGGHDHLDLSMPQRTNRGGGRYKKGSTGNKSITETVILELDKGDIDG